MLIHEIRAQENPFHSRKSEEPLGRDWPFVTRRERVRHLATLSIREEEMQAILRGVQRAHDATEEASEEFYLLNRRIVISGIVVLLALLGGVLFFRVGMPPLIYALPVGLALMYAVLIVISELRLGRAVADDPCDLMVDCRGDQHCAIADRICVLWPALRCVRRQL